MEKTIEINVQDNVLNIFTNTTLDDILKSMIKLDIEGFSKRYSEEIQKVNKTKFKSEEKEIEAILSAIDKKNATPGTRADAYIKKLKNDFFNHGEEYVELFHEQYLNNLEYHFNVRRVYGMGYSIENYESEDDYLDSLFLLLIKKFNPDSTGEYIPSKFTDVKSRTENYFSVYKNKKKIELYEKIGVIYQTEKNITKSVFVKYTFDFENDFFELSYNENTLKDLCNPSIDMKKIVLNSTDSRTISSKFANERMATLTLYSRMKELVESKLVIRSIGDQIAMIALEEETNKENEDEAKMNNLQSLNTESEAFNKSPFELAMYKFFKEDRDLMISKILGEDEEKDTSDIEHFIKEKFIDFDNDSISMSVKFLKHMKAFSKLKKKSHIVNGLDNFIFSFTVRDWAVTKSTTKNQERLPVYTSDFYWHLQEVVDGIKLINELGLHISTVISSGEKFYQEVKITLSNDHLIFVYYQNKKRTNKAKSIKNTLKISEARRDINDYIKNKFRNIVSEKSES